MGLLSSIGGAIKGAASAVGGAAATALDYGSAIFAHPIKTVEAAISPNKTIADVVKEYNAEPTGKRISDIALAGVGYATATLGVASVAKAGVTATATSLIPKTTTGKVVAAVATPIAIGAVANQPAKVLGIVSSAPSNLANFGGNVATLVAEPSIENFKKTVKENPVLSTLAGGAIAATVLGGVGLAANTLATYKNTKATKENTGGGNEAVVPASSATVMPSVNSQLKESAAAANIPVTPPTETVQAKPLTSTKKRRKSHRKENLEAQRIQIAVNNRINSTGIKSTKKYINREILLNT